MSFLVGLNEMGGLQGTQEEMNVNGSEDTVKVKEATALSIAEIIGGEIDEEKRLKEESREENVKTIRSAFIDHGLKTSKDKVYRGDGKSVLPCRFVMIPGNYSNIVLLDVNFSEIDDVVACERKNRLSEIRNYSEEERMEFFKILEETQGLKVLNMPIVRNMRNYRIFERRYYKDNIEQLLLIVPNVEVLIQKATKLQELLQEQKKSEYEEERLIAEEAEEKQKAREKEKEEILRDAEELRDILNRLEKKSIVSISPDQEIISSLDNSFNVVQTERLTVEEKIFFNNLTFSWSKLRKVMDNLGYFAVNTSEAIIITVYDYMKEVQEFAKKLENEDAEK